MAHNFNALPLENNSEKEIQAKIEEHVKAIKDITTAIETSAPFRGSYGSYIEQIQAHIQLMKPLMDTFDAEAERRESFNSGLTDLTGENGPDATFEDVLGPNSNKSL
ncbi:MAG: hypothetical protein M3Q73_00070 [bacterium]|nr:hypothetical protein [bacterium]